MLEQAHLISVLVGNVLLVRNRKSQGQGLGVRELGVQEGSVVIKRVEEGTQDHLELLSYLDSWSSE